MELKTLLIKLENLLHLKDSEAFENVVIGWLEDVLDVAQMAKQIEDNIKLQITPVNEDLYFTWQNPPVPPVEEPVEESE